MALKLKALLEGYAWERKADGSLPTLKDAIAVHEANQGSKPDFLDLDGDGNKTEPMKNAAKSRNNFKDYSDDALNDMIINLSRYENTENDIKLVKQELARRKEINEYGEDEFNRSPEMYSGGKSSREGGDHVILDLVSQAEDMIQNLRSNMATNSVLQRAEKMGYLQAYDELLDILSDIGYQAEME